MKEKTYTVQGRRFSSEAMPAISTEDPELGHVIAWADGHPVAWEIVSETKSAAFGRNSCDYIGWAQRNPAPEAVLERLRHFYSELQAQDYRGDHIWKWRAEFTFKHYKDPGFKGGFFQQSDGTYDRGCLTLDYTPETLGEVMQRFLDWTGKGPCSYKTAYVKIDGKRVDMPMHSKTHGAERGETCR